MSLIGIVLLSIGLAIDACCVCTTSGLIYRPTIAKSFEIALPFAIFQGVMPLIGYFGIGLLPDTLFRYNHIIAFVLLCLVGIKMLADALKPKDGEEAQAVDGKRLTIKIILVQAVSTSIDALTVGVTLGGQPIEFILMAVCLISAITLAMCFGAVILGEKIGTKLNSKAEILGGIVLVLIAFSLLLGGL